MVSRGAKHVVRTCGSKFEVIIHTCVAWLSALKALKDQHILISSLIYKELCCANMKHILQNVGLRISHWYAWSFDYGALSMGLTWELVTMNTSYWFLMNCLWYNITKLVVFNSKCIHIWMTWFNSYWFGSNREGSWNWASQICHIVPWVSWGNHKPRRFLEMHDLVSSYGGMLWGFLCLSQI